MSFASPWTDASGLRFARPLESSNGWATDLTLEVTDVNQGIALLDPAEEALLAGPGSGMPGGLDDALKDLEVSRILEVLATTSGNQRRAADVLGLRTSTLHEKLKRFGLLEEARRIRSGTQPPPAPTPGAEVFRYRGRLTAGQTLEVVGAWASLEVEVSLGSEFDITVGSPTGSAGARDVEVHVAPQQAGAKVTLTPKKGGATADAGSLRLSLKVVVPANARLLASRPEPELARLR